MATSKDGPEEPGFALTETPAHPIGEPLHQAEQEAPAFIGRYRIERLIGRGGFGLVYLAHDEQLRRLVAIKIPHARLVTQTVDAEAYLTEARTVAGLDHPNIVPVHDVGSTSEFPCFVVSKYIDGADLATRIKESRLSLLEILELTATIAEALHHAHKQGLVHRDIKPGNILLDKSRKPFVADFGLALREQDVGKDSRFAGTPVYMSPEQARGEGHRVDGRSDIFSLGVVFYELLTGRRPFKGETLTELMEQITKFEARPPRQIDDAIPKEVERICLKALSKRASERYTTAKDLADDLRHFIPQCTPHAPREALTPPTNEEIATPAGDTPRLSRSESSTLKIVPKGLRSFDAGDADFFLELLPGPRDRDGLPDSIRFWKTRIEQTDAESTFAVGLIYGSSGCGKSSLVKAGLLPRLAKSVIAVYIEATPEDTETRLLRGLQRQIPDLPGTSTLIEALALLRQGRYLEPRQKVLLVLDQFEQWLHAKRNDLVTDLTQALRQCDGGRLQCIVMVRDDFWMAATRFMRDLEISLLEGQNSAAVDLFPMRHAEKVLAAFGRAFGELPSNSNDDSKEHNQFLDQAVAGLSQEGKVISVRLALFAEMVKGKPWTPATLKDVGGIEGVGVTFLEETFTASTAPPQHRLHQKAAQAVLKALLPEAGTDIKGTMRSQHELLDASGYADRRRDFDDLLRILDSELRLITPTDPEGTVVTASGPLAGSEEPTSEAACGYEPGQKGTVVTASGSLAGSEEPTSEAACGYEAGQKYYQLTHDYLVRSLRDWLTRKQKETRRGRAELLLADRAAVWNARPENRQLPSLPQWFQIKWLTAKKHWTPPQRKMMAKAGRYHVLRGLAVAIVLLLLTWAGYETHGTLKAHALRDRLLDANTTDVPTIVSDMASYRRWIDPLLRDAAAQAEAGKEARKQLHASLALLPVDTSQVDYLYDRLLGAEPHEVPVMRDALAAHKEQLLDKLWAVVESPAKGKDGQRLRAAAALAKYEPDSAKWAKVQQAVGNDLVAVPAVYLAIWKELFRPVRDSLLPPLEAAFRNTAQSEIERTLATEILADYASDRLEPLADLVLDAEPKPFVTLFPVLAKHGKIAVAPLVAELAKKAPPPLTDKEIFKKTAGIAEDDSKVNDMRAKLFEVELQAGRKYKIGMASKEIDSFLVLQDTSGKELANDDDSGGGVDSLLEFTPPRNGIYKVWAASLPNPERKGLGEFVVTIMEAASIDPRHALENKSGGKTPHSKALARRQANAGVALLRLDEMETVWPLLKHSPDPTVRSWLIHQLGPMGADARVVVQRLDQETDVTIRRALILSLGEYSEANLPPAERTALVKKLQGIYRSAEDPGLHAAAEWLLRHWKETDWLAQTNDAWAKDKAHRDQRLASRGASAPGLKPELKPGSSPGWYVNSQGQTMVMIPGPVEFIMGSPLSEQDRRPDEVQHKKRIGRSFAIAAAPVTKEQFLRFMPGFTHQEMKRYPEPSCPIGGVTWYEAAAYCNWLSKEEGIAEDQWCYETNAKGQVTKLKANYLSLTGYRLPTEAEWEYACRANTQSSRSYGDPEELLGYYAWYSKNSAERSWPVGSNKPNDLGFFDVHGNMWNWCQGKYKAYPTGSDAKIFDDVEDSLTINPQESRVLRGGSFVVRASFVRSSLRLSNVPSFRNVSYGFRASRTFTP